jgi:hypothetical protein
VLTPGGREYLTAYTTTGLARLAVIFVDGWKPRIEQLAAGADDAEARWEVAVLGVSEAGSGAACPSSVAQPDSDPASSTASTQRRTGARG